MGIKNCFCRYRYPFPSKHSYSDRRDFCLFNKKYLEFFKTSQFFIADPKLGYYDQQTKKHLTEKWNEKEQSFRSTYFIMQVDEIITNRRKDCITKINVENKNEKTETEKMPKVNYMFVNLLRKTRSSVMIKNADPPLLNLYNMELNLGKNVHELKETKNDRNNNFPESKIYTWLIWVSVEKIDDKMDEFNMRIWEPDIYISKILLRIKKWKVITLTKEFSEVKEEVDRSTEWTLKTAGIPENIQYFIMWLSIVNDISNFNMSLLILLLWDKKMEKISQKDAITSRNDDDLMFVQKSEMPSENN